MHVPIALGVYGVLCEGVSAKEQARWLMEHPDVAEIDLPCDVAGARSSWESSVCKISLLNDLLNDKAHRCNEYVLLSFF
ncbi:hypothetical protein JB92DRAFT_1809858 [Gautieria morchelliformis]|nr:hypothetical protein JB92DRAFT_1809858 [Gautieria morchelliformis]